MVVAWHTVTSSNVARIGYEAATQELRVRFNSGAEYIYKNVPGGIFADFLGADSKGRYLNENIKGQYQYEKV